MARARLNGSQVRRQLACLALAVLLSMLSFAVLLRMGYGIVRSEQRQRAGAGAALNLMQADIVAEQRMSAARPSAHPSPQRVSAEAAGMVDPDTGHPVSAYIPVTELTERPSLIQDIDNEIALTVPGRDASSIDDIAAILLINEYGNVDRLLIESADLPRYLEAMLGERFAAARFRPGKLAGQPVRSALRIVVQLQ